MTTLFIDGAWLAGNGTHMHSVDPAYGRVVWDGSAATLGQFPHGSQRTANAQLWHGHPKPILAAIS